MQNTTHAESPTPGNYPINPGVELKDSFLFSSVLSHPFSARPPSADRRKTARLGFVKLIRWRRRAAAGRFCLDLIQQWTPGDEDKRRPRNDSSLAFVISGQTGPTGLTFQRIPEKKSARRENSFGVEMAFS